MIIVGSYCFKGDGVVSEVGGTSEFGVWSRASQLVIVYFTVVSFSWVVSYLRVTAVSLLGVFTVRSLVSVTLLCIWVGLRSVRLSVDQAPPSLRGHFPGFGLAHRTDGSVTSNSNSLDQLRRYQPLSARSRGMARLTS